MSDNIKNIEVYKVYEILKETYQNYIVMLKQGNFYLTFAEDAEIISGITAYKIIKKGKNIKAGFPDSALDKVIEKLDDRGVNFVIFDYNDFKYFKENEIIEIIEELQIDKTKRIKEDTNKKAKEENKEQEKIKENKTNGTEITKTSETEEAKKDIILNIKDYDDINCYDTLFKRYKGRYEKQKIIEEIQKELIAMINDAEFDTKMKQIKRYLGGLDAEY